MLKDLDGGETLTAKGGEALLAQLKDSSETSKSKEASAVASTSSTQQ